jgi:lipopolysaccharide transport protein LptA
MGASIRKSKAIGMCLGVATMLCGFNSGHAVTLKSDKPIALDADSSEFDYKNNTLVFHHVKISQADMSVEANEARANGLNFDNSRWVFRGAVKITFKDGSLTSDEAQIGFAGNALAKAVITGKPAAFEQQREKSGLRARGHAGRIEYDLQLGTVHLSGDAWLTDGQNEIKGQSLKYSVREQRVIAEASEQGPQRVKITINPPSKPKAPPLEIRPKQ